jgi:hypothetical protein
VAVAHIVPLKWKNTGRKKGLEKTEVTTLFKRAHTIALTAAADPHTFSGPRAPPLFSAMPKASFSDCFTLVTSEPQMR